MSKLKLQGVLFAYLNSSKGQVGFATVLLPHPIFCNFVSYSNSQNVHLANFESSKIFEMVEPFREEPTQRSKVTVTNIYLKLG